jgi:hypothetical protein
MTFAARAELLISDTGSVTNSFTPSRIHVSAD